MSIVRSLIVLFALALGGLAPSGVAVAQMICPTGVIVWGNSCPPVSFYCNDGTKIPEDVRAANMAHKFCEARGGGNHLDPTNLPKPKQPVEQQPAPAPVSTARCNDGSTISTATVAAGRGAMTTYCSGRGGIRGAVGGNR